MKKILFVVLILIGVIKGCSLLYAKTATPNYTITQQALRFCKKIITTPISVFLWTFHNLHMSNDLWYMILTSK